MMKLLILLIQLMVLIHNVQAQLGALGIGVCKSMVEPAGYTCQEHTVTTQDGYILSLQRIPNGRSGQVATKPPVLVQHGISVNAESWMVNSPDKSLPFMLADEGYDVWLSNTRGTQYSRRHTSLPTINPLYWNWSWEELSEYEFPAFVEYVYGQTNQKLNYVGHSLGTMTALVALSQNKEVELLRSAALLSPIAHLSLTPSAVTKLTATSFAAESMMRMGVMEFFPGGDGLRMLLGFACSGIGAQIPCAYSLNAINGPSCCTSPSVTDNLINHALQSTSSKNLAHLSQNIRTGIVAKYDYGVLNQARYGQPTPPLYNLANIPKDFPLLLSYGGNDYLSDVNDVNVLLNELQDHDQDKLVVQFVDDYAHADFILADDANTKVYQPIMEFFQLHYWIQPVIYSVY